jgi:hypothetical protein
MESVLEKLSCCEARDQLERESCASVREMLMYFKDEDFSVLNEHYGIDDIESNHLK